MLVLLLLYKRGFGLANPSGSYPYAEKKTFYNLLISWWLYKINITISKFWLIFHPFVVVLSG